MIGECVMEGDGGGEQHRAVGAFWFSSKLRVLYRHSSTSPLLLRRVSRSLALALPLRRSVACTVLGLRRATAPRLRVRAFVVCVHSHTLVQGTELPYRSYVRESSRSPSLSARTSVRLPQWAYSIPPAFMTGAIWHATRRRRCIAKRVVRRRSRTTQELRYLP